MLVPLYQRKSRCDKTCQQNKTRKRISRSFSGYGLPRFRVSVALGHSSQTAPFNAEARAPTQKDAPMPPHPALTLAKPDVRLIFKVLCGV
jgi:hypothetical protein